MALLGYTKDSFRFQTCLVALLGGKVLCEQPLSLLIWRLPLDKILCRQQAHFYKRLSELNFGFLELNALAFVLS